MPDIDAASSAGRRYEVKPYAPDGGFRLDGLLVLLVVLAVSGTALGLAAHLLGKLIYFVIIYPLAIGFGIGAIGVRFVRSGGVRNQWLAGGAGFLGGMLAVGVMHYARFVEYRDAMVQQLPPAVLSLDDGGIDALAASQAAREPSTAGLQEQLALGLRAVQSPLAFVQLSAREGVKLSKLGSSGVTLGYVGSLAYWGIELLIVAALANALMREQSKRPYCRRCEAWKDFARVGYLHGDFAAAERGVKEGDVASLAAGQLDAAAPSNRWLHRALCPVCQGFQSTVELKLVEHLPGSPADRDRLVALVSWPGPSLAVIEAACVRGRSGA